MHDAECTGCRAGVGTAAEGTGSSANMAGIDSTHQSQFQRAHSPAAAGLFVALAACVAGAGGCVSAFTTHRQQLEALHAQGRYDIAATALDDPAVKAKYGEKDVLLYWLDRGSIALANHNPGAAVDWLDRAESYMEVNREPSAGETFAQWLINDTAAPYYGSSYEELYVNVFKLVAQLEAGQIEGGATVEARRMAGKADVLRDRYLRTREVVAKEGDSRVRASLGGGGVPGGAGGTVEVSQGGQFIDSTLGDFLTAVTFMKDGDRDNQRVAGKRLATAIQSQSTLQQGVAAGSFDTIGELSPETVNVLFVALSGRGPTKVAERVGPIPVYEWPVYFELPVLRGGSEEAASVRIVAADPATAQINPAGAPMAKVEDMRAVAEENFRRELPLIYARTVLRSSLKAAGSFAATEAVRQQAHGRGNQGLVQLGMVVAGLAFVALTEQADLRSWVFLPARADAALLKLPPGRHRLRAEFLSATGGVLYAGPWREIEVGGGEKALTTVVEHFWR